jgi:hypothetical protein
MLFKVMNGYQIWYNFLGKKERIRPYILVVRNERDDIQSLLPLGIKKFGFIRCLIWLRRIVTDYHCPIVSEKYNEIVIKIEDFMNRLKNTLPGFDVIVFGSEIFISMR